MKKKKEQKKFLSFFRLTARTWIISMPTAIILALLVLFREITPLTALGLLFLVILFTSFVTFSVFKELENFILYLKKLAQGLEIEPPRFKKGIFSSFRLADTFQSVKNLWTTQTLSDSLILENLPDPLLMIDERGILVFANRKARHIFGNKIIHKQITQIFSDKVLNRAISAVLNEKTATEWFEWEINQSDKSYTFQVRLEHLPAPTRNKAIAVMTLNDVTPFKRFREQQIEFFANASHELNTPLSIISGFVETLQGPAKDDEQARQQFLGMMSEQVTRMTGLVQSLLQLSRQQTITGHSHNDIILLPDLIQTIIRDLQLKAERHQKEIVFLREHDIPRLIGNRSEMQHIFQNLIDNAIKYGEKNTSITIRIFLTDGFPNHNQNDCPAVAVSIHNQGNPISPRHLDKLFDRFYRVNSVENHHVEGTGLGLGIAQQLVYEHGGTIDVTSTAKEGTTFTVYLPCDL